MEAVSKRRDEGPGGGVRGSVLGVAFLGRFPLVEVRGSSVSQALECLEPGLQNSAVAPIVVPADLDELGPDVGEEGSLQFLVVGIGGNGGGVVMCRRRGVTVVIDGLHGGIGW